jgi:hypothetical protein
MFPILRQYHYQVKGRGRGRGRSRGYPQTRMLEKINKPKPCRHKLFTLLLYTHGRDLKIK